MDALIEQKRAETRGDPEQEARAWLERLAAVDQERRGYLRLAATGRMSEDELDAALVDLEETRRTAERDLEAIRGRRDEIEQLERDRNTVLASWSEAVPENLGRLTPQERNKLYGMLRLEILPTDDGYEVTGPFCSLEPLSWLKVTHHGSNTSSTPLFLGRFPPKIAVIKVGADNPYGHPTPETLDRLRRAGARVLRNDEDGDVIVTIKGGEAKVAVTKP